MGDFLKENAAHIHFMDLKPKHVSEPALRRSFMTQPEVQIAAIREVYEDGLGELMRQHAELGNKIAAQENKIDAQRRTGRPARALVPQREQLRELEQRRGIWSIGSTRRSSMPAISSRSTSSAGTASPRTA